MTSPDHNLEQLARIAPHYQIGRELGRGGMGIVYLARELQLDRPVALKVLPPHLASNPTIRERFLREARTAAQLSHPNIVPIYRAEEVDGFAYFAMAYIEGENLAERVRDRGPLPAAEVVRIMRESAWALAYAHARGVIHRDIKAANIMIERASGRAIVTDFGIARDSRAAALTADGEVLGTVHYMAPEQANGEPVDGRSDLYSLGIAGYHALSGRLPFEGDNPAAVLVAVASRPAPSLALVAPAVPERLVAVVDRCLRRDPADRFATGEQLAEALERSSGDPAVSLPGAKPDRMIPEAEARALWLRAAQLQAEAATRLELRSREGSGFSAVSPADPTTGYRLRDVELAAREVGIGAEFVALALAEQPTGAGARLAAAGLPEERVTTALLGTSQRSLSVSRVLRASPKLVLDAIGQLFPARPYLMAFQDAVGGHPLDGGVMSFAVPNMMQAAGASVLSTYTSFTYRMYQLELFQLNVTLRPVQAQSAACEVTIYGDLRSGMHKNLKADGWIAAALGAIGGGLGAVGGFAAGIGALSALPALGAAAVVGGVSLIGYRASYRHALRKATTELEGLLAALEAQLRSGQLFGTRPILP